MSTASIPSAATSILIGPAEHGAVRHGAAIAALTGSPVIRQLTPGGLAVPAGTPVAHLHYTDRLFGATTESAATSFVALAARLAPHVVVTLHDVPTGSTAPLDVRRAASYRRVSAAADAVIVASSHEGDRLRVCGAAVDATVIPLPIDPPAAFGPARPTASGFCAARRPHGGPAVGVLGFIYPGKGHAEVLAAMELLDGDAWLWALGAVSPGHDELANELRNAARRQHRPLVIAGPVADDHLGRAMRDVDVPVVPAIAPSASASLATWIAAGRRPLVAASAYACEVAAAGPDLLTLYNAHDPAELAVALNRALADPASTIRTTPIPPALRADAVADAHLRLYQQLAGDG
ncbi:hypothetical protein BH18ACT2_BH18ACT2_16460 [soil metagenome]